MYYDNNIHRYPPRIHTSNLAHFYCPFNNRQISILLHLQKEVLVRVDGGRIKTLKSRKQLHT